MGDEKKKQQGNWLSTLLALALVAMLVGLFFVPPAYMERLLTREREFMFDAIGEAELKYFAKASAAVDIKTISDMMQPFGFLGKRNSDQLFERAKVVWLLCLVVAYRIQQIMLWYLTGLGLLLAACCDGYYVWRIRQTVFQSQSPLRHRIGIYTTWTAVLLVLGWIVIPIPMPVWIGGGLLLLTALGLWTFLAYLQKRI